jgi:hypothetical protein
MRTRSTTVSSVSWLVAAALTIAPLHAAVAAPAETAPPAETAAEPPAEGEPAAESTPEEAAATSGASIQTNLDTANAKVAEAQAKVEGAAKAEDMEAALTEAETALGEAKTALGDAKAAIEESKAELAVLRASLEESQTELAAITGKGKAKDKARADVQAVITATESEIAATEGSITASEAAIGEVETAIGEVETAIGEVRADAEAKAVADAEAKAKADAEAEAAQALEDERPPEPRIGKKPAKGKGLMIAGGTLAGVGLGLTVAFTLMTRNCSFDGPLQCRLQNQDDFLIPMGAAALLTGVMVLGVGVGYHIRYKRWERWTPENGKRTAFVPTASRNGGGLAVVGRF